MKIFKNKAKLQMPPEFDGGIVVGNGKLAVWDVNFYEPKSIISVYNRETGDQVLCGTTRVSPTHFRLTFAGAPKKRQYVVYGV